MARLAALALGCRHHAGPLGRREVVRALLPRLLRGAHGPLGRRRASRRRGPWLGRRRRRQGRAVCVRAARRHRRRHLRGELDRLDPHQGRLLPHVGAEQPRHRLRLAARLVALAVGVPPADVRVDAGDHLLAPVPDQPVVLARPGTADVVLLRGPEEGRRRVPRRPVQQGDHLDRHRLHLVGRDARDLRAALHVGAAPRLARRRDPLRPASPATCRGSSSGTGRSTPSTRSRSSPTPCSLASTSSGSSSAAATPP